jgi:hypothetical protein
LLFKSGGKKTKLKRTYKKIFGTLGEVGGFIEIAIGIMAFIYVITKCNKSEDRMREEILKEGNCEHYKRYFVEDFQEKKR